MRLGILGSHPDVKAGFASAMSINQIAAFSKCCKDIVLYLPEEEMLSVAGTSMSAAALDKLDRYGMDFRVEYIGNPGDYDSDLDVLIWQTYDASLEYLYPNRRNFLTTKSYPRFAANATPRYRKKYLSQLQKFDRLAMSLQKDVELGRELVPEASDRIGFVPRGFSSAWLRSEKPSTPTFSCDAPVKVDLESMRRAVAHMNDLFRSLAKVGRKFKVISARRTADLLDVESKRIPAIPLFDYYRNFIKPGWIYLPCNYEFSIHSRNQDLTDTGESVFVGLFENEIVESQLSGGVPIYKAGHLDPSIIFDPTLCSISSYSEPQDLLERTIHVIDNFDHYSDMARSFSEKNYSHDAMREAWLHLLDAT